MTAHASAVSSTDSTPRAVWLGLLAPPGAWALVLLGGWWLSGRICSDGSPTWGALSAGAARAVIVALGLAAVATAAAGMRASWRAFSERRAHHAGTLAGVTDRDRVAFMALAASIVSGLFLVGTLWTAVAVGTVRLCETMR